MKNKYSLNAESYGISKVRWRVMKEEVIRHELDSLMAVFVFDLLKTEVNGEIVFDEELCAKRIWFLYDILLQEKYNHLYKREKLVNPKVGDYVYCDAKGYGRGQITSFSLDKTLMTIEFDKRTFGTFCDAKSLTVNIDNEKVKITRL